MSVIVSLFRSPTDTRPQRAEMEWDEFAKSFTFLEGQSKLELPLWSPAEFKQTGKRTNDDVIAVHCLALDFDSITEQQAVAACDVLSHYQAIVYTTWSHKPSDDKWCLRAVLALSRSLLPSEWPVFWSLAVGALGLPADTQCKDAARAYFPCAGIPGSKENHFQLSFDGSVLDVDAVLRNDAATSRVALPPLSGSSTDPSNEALPAYTTKVPQEAFEKFAKRAAGKQSMPQIADLGERLLLVRRGMPFADPGERDVVLFQLASMLAERWPKADPAALADFFSSSLSAMQSVPGAPTVVDVLYKIKRAQESIRIQREHHEQEQLTTQQHRIREAFKNGRCEPYRPEECAPSFRWVLQKAGSFYFWLDGGYSGPYTREDARAAAVRDLMPAAGVVELFELDRNGTLILKSLEKLVVEYGTVVHEVVSDLCAEKASYEEATRTVIEAPCPMRELEPAFDANVDKWLQLLGGERIEDLKTWIAALGRLDLPCAALFLVGPRGAGKSLFAHGHSRLWSTCGPTYLDEVMANFNDGLLRCPLTFADESLPKDYRGFARNAELRLHIQATSRPLNRKFMPVSTLRGATRTVVAANNEEVLATAENLSSDDIDAIGARYFILKVEQACSDFLAEINPRAKGWVDGNVIAKHARWLIENHEWRPKERFIIATKNQNVTKSLAIRSGIRSALCQWLVGFLLEPGRYTADNRNGDFIKVRNHRLLVNVRGLERCWEIYVRHENCPPTGKLSSALATISNLRTVDSKGVAYRVIDVRYLVAWAEETGFADRDQIAAALEKETETAIPFLTQNN